MMPDRMMPPPAIDGVTEGVTHPDPMRMLSMMLSPQQTGTGMQHLMEAITHLKQAGQADPRLHDQIADALRILLQGQTTDRDDDGQPPCGPSSFRS